MKTKGSRPPAAASPNPKRRSGIWIVINMALIGITAYIVYTRERRVPAEPAAEISTPTPAPAAAPAPIAARAPEMVSMATPVPVAATPAPPIALSRVDRRALPRQVMLLKPVDFVLLSQQGQPIGSAHAVAGNMVALVGVVGDAEVEVQMGESRQTVPASSTDIDSRVRAILKSMGAGAAASGP